MFGRLTRVGRSFGFGLALMVAACGPADPPRLVSFDPGGATTAFDVVADGLDQPVDLAPAGDGSGRLFVVEQTGRVRIVDGTRILDRPFLDIAAQLTFGGERGLLGIAFHPGFATDPRFFVDYTDLEGDTVISEFRVGAADPNVAEPDSERVLLQIAQPFANHNGGGLAFGPDGMLYISTGDGGSGGDPLGNGQKMDTLLGKILRIDVDGPVDATGPPYRTPHDNPFFGIAGARPEIWLTGLRNPWRIRFDALTGDLWIGDVGQNAWEEIDVARAGSKGLNFGWNRMEGFHCHAPSDDCDKEGLTMPLAEYGHDLGCAVIGGVVVRGSGQSLLDGRYVFTDACSGNLWLLDPAGGGRREPTLAGSWRGSLSSIAQAEDGRVLATDLHNGQLLAIATVAP